jgi:hypothetical protein
MLRGMKLCVFLLIFCCWAVSVQAASPSAKPAKGKSQAPAPAVRNTPVIDVPETTFDFGEAFEGTEVTHDFVVKNTGKADLLIDQVRPG